MSVRLTLNGLSHRYPRSRDRAITDLSLTVAPGETVALLGPSGCGKTTTLKVIAGLLRPSAGDVLLDDASVIGVAPERRDTAMVFQNPLLFPHMSVADNVGFGLRMRGVPKTQRKQRVLEALGQVHMQRFASRRPHALSGGEQSRVALARALITQPRLLLLDEPLSALDPSLRGDMRALLLRLQAEGPHTTVFVTHDQLEAVLLADRIALILDGRLQMLGRPRDFYERPVSRAVAEFFGATNFITGRLNAGTLETAAGAFNISQTDASAATATATIRPEALRLGNGKNSVSARVCAGMYMGTRVQYTLALGDLRLQAAFAPDVRLTPGDAVTIDLPPQSLWVLKQPEP